jgi:hypothetical protein
VHRARVVGATVSAGKHTTKAVAARLGKEAVTKIRNLVFSYQVIPPLTEPRWTRGYDSERGNHNG